MVDIECYAQNGNRAQVVLQGRLKDVLDRTLRSAEVVLDRTWRQDQGHGQLIVLPVGINEATVVPLLIRGLLAHLDRDLKRSPQIPLRLLVSLVQGIVTRAKTGYVGRAVVTAARLLESTAVQEELKSHPAALFALIVSDDLYQDVLVHGYSELPADDFRRASIDLPEKEWHGEAWVRAWEPGSLKPPANRSLKALRDAVMPVAGAVPQTVYDLLSPETGTDQSGATHETTESHEAGIGVVEYLSEDHAYVSHDQGYSYVEEYTDHAEYAAVDYESADSSADSPDELYLSSAGWNGCWGRGAFSKSPNPALSVCSIVSAEGFCGLMTGTGGTGSEVPGVTPVSLRLASLGPCAWRSPVAGSPPEGMLPSASGSAVCSTQWSRSQRNN
jgi:hypothetical protein